MKITRFRSLIFVFVLLFSMANICAAGPISTKPVAEFEDGKLYSAGQFHVVELSRTYRQMGRQYGRLLAGPIKEMYAIRAGSFRLQNIRTA